MRLIIFDVDGTLVDSQHEIVEAQARAFAVNGLPAPDRQTALSVVGLSLSEAFAKLAGEAGPLEGLAEAYKAAWTDLRMRPGFADRLYPGAAEIIAELGALPGVRLGIATGKSRRGVDRILAAQGWADLFVTIQTADDHPSKPNPSMIQKAMLEASVDPVSTLMIGDTTYDVEMAVAAGVRAIGVAWGYHSPIALMEAGACTVVADFAALLSLLTTCSQETV